MMERRKISLAPAAKLTMRYVTSNMLTVLTIIGVIFGITFGFIIRNCKQDEWTQREHAYVKFGGELFLRMLKALTLPLIATSIVAALGSLDMRLSGKVGSRTFLFYLVTTVAAVIVGVSLVTTIQPGRYYPHTKADEGTKLEPRKIFNSDVIMDIFRNMFPSNLARATMYQYQTILDIPTPAQIQEKLSKNMTIEDDEFPTKTTYIDGTNILGIVVFSTLFGIALSCLGELGKPVLKLVRCFTQLFMLISSWVLWLSPIGIFFLLTGRIVEIENLEMSLNRTPMFVVTVLLGLAIHGLVVLPIIYFVTSGSHPFKVYGDVLQALLTAFGTSSSTAALPATMSCMEDKHGVDPRVSRFVLPLGAAINMDGTALYQVVAAIFLTQLNFGMELDFGSVLAISFIAIVSSIGVSGIPNAGLVTMTMLMNILGLPMTDIGFLIPMDWALHRFRTTVNVLGDAVGASLVNKMCQDELEQSLVKPSNSESEDLNKFDV